MAKYLGGSAQAEMSIKLEMGKPEARMWAEIRQTVPGLFGYQSVDETEEALWEFLG